MSPFDASQKLTLQNADYKKIVKHYLWGAYRHDIATGDLTTRSFLTHPNQTVKARITTNQTGIVAGFQEVQWFLKELDLQIKNSLQDGQNVSENTNIMTLTGSAQTLLAAERTLLNLLQRMSGIATYTHQFRQKMVGNIDLLTTRKTLWGMLDKRAVSLGGGKTHRLHLGDAVLIKDNHLRLEKDWIDRLAEVLLGANKARFVEIEVDNLEMAQQVLNFFHNVSAEEKNKAVVMLDNFTPNQVKAWAPALAATGILVEVSGGITMENVSNYLHPGVSAISSGALTMEAHHLDMSLHIA